MSLAAMQTAMTRMLVDEQWRVAFLRGDVEIPQLTDKEVNCLRRTDASMLEIQADLLIRKRVSLALDLLPLSARLLPDLPEGMLSRYVHRYPSAGTPRLEALRLAALLDDYIEASGVGEYFLRDLLRYETIILHLLESPGARPPVAEGCIVRSDYAAVVPTDVDLIDLISQLEAADDHPQPVARQATVLVVIDPQGSATTAEIDTLHTAILSLCERPTAETDIAAIFGEHRDAREAIRWLADIGAVILGGST